MTPVISRPSDVIRNHNSSVANIIRDGQEMTLEDFSQISLKIVLNKK